MSNDVIQRLQEIRDEWSKTSDKRRNDYYSNSPAYDECVDEIYEFAKELAGKCKCGAQGGMPHSCPYRSEIAGDDETLCNCCSDCRWQCQQDI